MAKRKIGRPRQAVVQTRRGPAMMLADVSQILTLNGTSWERGWQNGKPVYKVSDVTYTNINEAAAAFAAAVNGSKQ